MTGIAHFSGSHLRPFKLVFAEAGPGPTLELGPFAEIWIDGETLRASRDGPVLAKHNPHSWEARGRKFFRVDCESPVRLQFVNAPGEEAEAAGPFAHFSCADGIAYGDGQIHGNIDLESRRWYGHRDRRYWRHLVVRTAAAPAG